MLKKIIAAATVLVAVTGTAKAEGSLALGILPSGTRFSYAAAANWQTVKEADAQALAQCRGDGLRSCRVIWRFTKECVAVAEGPGWIARGQGSTKSKASKGALHECKGHHTGACRITLTACDAVTQKVPTLLCTQPLFKEMHEHPEAAQYLEKRYCVLADENELPTPSQSTFAGDAGVDSKGLNCVMFKPTIRGEDLYWEQCGAE